MSSESGFFICSFAIIYGWFSASDNTIAILGSRQNGRYLGIYLFGAVKYTAIWSNWVIGFGS